MLPQVHIRQDVLKKWIGKRHKIDAVDALIVSLIRSLSPDNPKVAEYMWNGRYRLTRKYIREMLPLLEHLTDDWISRRLRLLEKVGLVDICMRQTGKGKERYVKLSRLYWAEEDRANKEADKQYESHRDYTPSDTEKANGSRDRNHDGCTPNYHINDQRVETPVAATADGPSEGPPPAGSTAERDKEVGQGLQEYRQELDRRNRKEKVAVAARGRNEPN